MHTNVTKWLAAGSDGPRPCDWCGCALHGEKYIHLVCQECGRPCYRQEALFYTQLGYDGYSDVKLPDGYQVSIPTRDAMRREEG